MCARVLLISCLVRKDDRHQRAVSVVDRGTAHAEVMIELLVKVFEAGGPRGLAGFRIDDHVVLRDGNRKLIIELGVEACPHLAGSVAVKAGRTLPQVGCGAGAEGNELTITRQQMNDTARPRQGLAFDCLAGQADLHHRFDRRFGSNRRGK